MMYDHPVFKDDRALHDALANTPPHVVYGQLLGRPEWGDDMLRLVPDHMQMGFVRYMAYGPRSNSGSFMIALVNNDLMGAFGRADPTNRIGMFEWCQFLTGSAPRGSFGHPTAYEDWPGVLRQPETETNNEQEI